MRRLLILFFSMFILAGTVMVRHVDERVIQHANDLRADNLQKQMTFELLHVGEAKVQEIIPVCAVVQAVASSLCSLRHDEVARSVSSML